ncbi:Fanconi anemia group C protein [Alosa pseudoharengus]|uniref:Fanconi anemia group C protein n=1 Tax=Alosa pseudoharengus TaxID=34774 RepID=UPI003F88E81E
MASWEKPEPFSKTLVQFWMAKVSEWSEAPSPSAQLDACRHQEKLRGFLQEVLGALRLARCASEALENLPFVGQLLGRLCSVPCVTADEESSSLLLQCLWTLFSPTPRSAIELKANDWIRKTMCHLVAADEEGWSVMKHVGLPSKEYNVSTLKKMMCLLTEAVNRGCSSFRSPTERCLCDGLHSLSLTCVPLVTRPEAAPLIGALLRRSVTCAHTQLSEEFVEAVCSGFLDKKLHLDVQTVVALWCHNLSSLERAVLRLVSSVLSGPRVDLQTLDKQVNASLLPQACAQRCSVFLVVNEIFRCMLLEMEESSVLRLLIQSFTRCFLRALAAQDPEDRLALKSFFPLVTVSLQMPVLTLPSEVPQDVWLEHLMGISAQLQLASAEAEERVDNASGSVFEVWFLLLQGGGWVDVAAQLLASAQSHAASSSSSSFSSSSESKSRALLWLLTFFYHPTNRGHQRTQQWECVQQVWGDLRGVCLSPTPPPPRALDTVAESLLSRVSSRLALRLLLSLAAFSPAPGDAVALQLIQKMSEKKREEDEEEEEEAVSLRREAECLLAAAAEHRLNSDTLASARVQARLRTLEDTLWNALCV